MSLLLLGTVLFCGNGAKLNAQYAYTDCAGNSSCTNPSNSGFFSSGALDLSYDNVISSFHSSATYAQDGTIKVWGEASKPINAGAANNHVNWFGVPTTINATNGFIIDGRPLKIALASLYTKVQANTFGGAQYVLLTTTGKLYAWGFKGILVPTALTPSAGEALQEIRTGGGGGVALGLPTGVNPTDVKMFFGTAGTLAITTCQGDVYVLSQNDRIRQGGSGTQWVKIKKDAANDLTNIVAVRGTSAGLFALDRDGNLWTWGYGTRLGNGTGSSDRQYAMQMTLPGGTGPIKMIAATKRFRSGNIGSGGSNTSTNSFEFSNNTISYFILYENGSLFAMGENTAGQLGDFSNVNRNNWIQPRYAQDGGSANQMTNIKWISTQEHDAVTAFVSVITDEKKLYNWGVESGADMGRGPVSTTGYSVRRPGMPENWSDDSSNSDLLLVENGGHTTMVLQECKNTFGYVGHFRYGSMGDGRAGSNDSGDDEFKFTTSPLPICGIETTPATFTVESATQDNAYCSSLNTIQLTAAPTGGVYKILEVDYGNNFYGLKFKEDANNTLDLSEFNIPTNGSRTVRLGYVIPEGEQCVGNEVQLLITIYDCVVYNIAISGKIWIDTNEDAIDDTPESNLTNSSRYANLVDANGDVIRSVPVDPLTGEYTILAGKNSLTSVGDYKIILTTSQITPGNFLDTGAPAPAGYKYTGTNRSNGEDPASSGNTTESSGILNLGDLSTYAGGTADVTLDDANFGVKDNISISGNVWHDANGTAAREAGEKPVNGDGGGDDNGGAYSTTGSDIYANLVDENDNVIASVKVNPDGTYRFTDVPHGNYKVVLTTTYQTPDDPIGTPGVPTDWVATGTNYENTPNTGNRSNTIDLGIVTTNKEGIDFGIQQLPVADDKNHGLTDRPSVDDEVDLDGLPGNPPLLTGTDPEDGVYAGKEGTTNNPQGVVITSLPTNGELYYDGVLVDSDDVTNSTLFNDPSMFSIKFTGSGYSETIFKYAYVDIAGFVGEEASYRIYWTGALPVKLVSFSALSDETGSRLLWTTSEEINSAYFEILHSSDAKHWKSVGNVASTGNSTEQSNYSYVHDSPVRGLNYYRLKMVDLDGSHTLSNIENVEIRREISIILYPNPTSGRLKIKDADTENINMISIHDLTGRAVLQLRKLPVDGIDVSAIPNGLYQVRIDTSNGESTSHKIVIRK